MAAGAGGPCSEKERGFGFATKTGGVHALRGGLLSTEANHSDNRMPSHKKILLIDDDSAMAEFIGFMVSAFRLEAFTVEHVADFDGGLQRLLSGAYAICLLDYHLGERDGLELLREAKARDCTTPVILLTGDSREETDIAAMEGGAIDFIEKFELNPRLLERAVRYALKMAEALAQLQEQASHDELTQLANRREFDRRLEEEGQRSLRFQRPLALVMMDLNRFKHINDTCGHLVGDEVLRHVARLLAGQIRQGDCLARYGGDEFALLMIETDLKGAQIAAARLRAAVVEQRCRDATGAQFIELSLSTGVAAWPETAAMADVLVSTADAALYEAKRLVANRTV